MRHKAKRENRLGGSRNTEQREGQAQALHGPEVKAPSQAPWKHLVQPASCCGQVPSRRAPAGGSPASSWCSCCFFGGSGEIHLQARSRNTASILSAPALRSIPRLFLSMLHWSLILHAENSSCFLLLFLQGICFLLHSVWLFNSLNSVTLIPPSSVMFSAPHNKY